MVSINEFPLEILNMVFKQIYVAFYEQAVYRSGPRHRTQIANWCRNKEFFRLALVCKTWQGIILNTAFEGHHFHQTPGKFFYCWSQSNATSKNGWIHFVRSTALPSSKARLDETDALGLWDLP